jgi:hypothetical protein
VYGNSDPLPEFLKAPIVDVFVNSSEGEYPPGESYPENERYTIRVSNPFFSGPSGASDQQGNIIREYQWGYVRQNNAGVTIKEQVEIALAEEDFSKFCNS